MKDPNEILQQKVEELARVRHEIESLQVVASLLDEPTRDEPTKKKESAAEKTLDTGSQATGTNGLFSAVTASRSNLWSLLKRRK